MAMSDLELLQLVETVKEQQRGPQGPAGVGIDSVEQYDGTSFTVKLTDGSFKKIALQPGADGQPGAVGPAGPQGAEGAPGRDGRPGKDGLQGSAGPAGDDGTVLDSAIISSAGNLLIGLSDGTIIDTGRVVGPAGAVGERGPVGLPGQPGVDGTSTITQFRAPSADDGKEGDSWIDCSSAEFAFYKRDGNGWSKLANLRQPAKDPRMGVAGGGGGDAGSTTYGSAFPAFAKVGAQHVMDDTLYEYVYTGGAWMQIVGSGGGGGGGATTLGALTDVNLSGTQKGDVFIATNNSTWENSSVMDGGTY